MSGNQIRNNLRRVIDRIHERIVRMKEDWQQMLVTLSIQMTEKKSRRRRRRKNNKLPSLSKQQLV